MDRDLTRRLTAEFIGTSFLVAAIVGSGIMAERLSTDPGLQLLQNALATAGVLTGMILAFSGISGAHFNPAVTIVERVTGGMGRRDAVAYVVAQIAGGIVGVVAANLMFDLSAVTLSTTGRAGSHLWLAEVVATLGLLLVIFGPVRTRRPSVVAFSVGAYIAAVYYFTASTGFANPAATFARMLTDTFSGIDPVDAPAFVIAQLVGAAAAVVLIRFVLPDGDREPAQASSR